MGNSTFDRCTTIRYTLHREGIFTSSRLEKGIVSMSKQSPHQASRREQRRAREQQRIDQQRRAPQAKRMRTLILLAASLAVLLGLVALIVLQKQTPGSVAYRPIDTVSCDGGEHSDFHIHADDPLHQRKACPHSGLDWHCIRSIVHLLAAYAFH